MCAYKDIFQDKLDDLLVDIKVVNPYIDDIIVHGKGSFSQHPDQIIVIFYRLFVTGIKVNDPKCSFRLKDLHNL